MLRQQLQQKLQQKLSPAQIQVIKMLEVPTLELEERIRQEIEENPALEEGAEVDNDVDDFDEGLTVENCSTKAISTPSPETGRAFLLVFIIN